MKKMSKYLYEFTLDCGRQGYIESVFIATEEDVKSIIGKRVYFGEVLGKHSEIECTLKKEDFRKIEGVSQNTLVELEDIFPQACDYNDVTIISGHNPFEYLEEEYEDEDEDDEDIDESYE